MHKMKQLAPFALLILLLGIVGRMDYDDHIQMERYKCECNQGVWQVESNGNQYCGGKYGTKN
ncbi:hypothetical protein MHD_04515 [Mannheimia granulomatis]|uniref:Uncharacterized protein n=1 Tax=Mannheimia granulomatis TaxID=85402 RepID=A0A011MGB2_9PAST|nr:hypothetical protein [Mannheimia granulomatis]EXI61496.1 hypothetical protein AK33_09705 [Mannheimia granulomatis]RGE48386.1 hypothetical protein MHD_04515 [Mannheimia granulomatis]